ncbi:YheC/D like ATP-grasp [Anaerobranca californiensis DSM 14826]|jgi:hypothetical protein|uniref:YheC/D like ATP-grasp n=1 Tax=Anaerobranca californiensis DSM 14826 TaxID=1120989 RepID=A0A1M6PEU6_9FIRM|nr:YheC/YheD family protein [Anaerobranca californiensis]SHK06437.1 YheC/D like ATP-grasp [Anaerobranca californiensis DSM 14826]
MIISQNFQESNKLIKHQVLWQNPKIKKHLLETIPYSKKGLKEMLDKYHYLYIKPVNGSLGKGVMSIFYFNKKYILRERDKCHTFDSLENLERYISVFLKKEDYLIQQGLHLLKYNNRHTDIRVLFQKPYDTWLLEGIGVRIGKIGYIVSNYTIGGNAITLENYLSSNGFDLKTIEKTKNRIITLCQEGIYSLTKSFPYFHRLGFDIGLDYSLTPWIIEVNTSPNFNLFKKLSLELYGKIKNNNEIINKIIFTKVNFKNKLE